MFIVISILCWCLQAQENDFKLQNKTMMEEISHVSYNCMLDVCFILLLFMKLTDQRDMLNTELSQAMHGNVDNDEYRRLQAENTALRKSLGKGWHICILIMWQ